MAEAARRLFEERHVSPDAVRVPAGFTVEVAATGLNNPSSVEFDEDGNIFVAEMGSPSGWAESPGRIVRVRDDGSTEVVIEGFSGSITGMAYYEGNFYVIEHAEHGRVYWLQEDGTRELLVDGLPGGGDHPTSDIVFAHSERMYFGQGTRTNSGIVGTDNAWWLARHPTLHDIPGRDVVLTGKNFETQTRSIQGTVLTGAFKSYGEPISDGEMIHGSVLSSGSIMRADPDEGGEFEVFAWGLRRPFGLSVHADGRIFCTDMGMQNRGSRGVADGQSYMWQIREGKWYGWPDYTGGKPVTDPEFKPQNAPQSEFLMKEHPELAEGPIISLPAGSGIAKFDFSRSPLFGSDDIAFVALMGETGSSSDLGCKVITVDIATGYVEDFATNMHSGPASLHQSGGLERPIATKFDRTGEFMYILDLGIYDTNSPGITKTLSNTGVLWRIAPSVLA